MLSYSVEIPPLFYHSRTNWAQQKYMKSPASSGIAEVQGKIFPRVYLALGIYIDKKKVAGGKEVSYPQKKKC